MFGTGIVAKLRRKARAIDIAELSKELEESRAAMLDLAGEHFVLKALISSLTEHSPEFREQARAVLAGRLIEASHPLSRPIDKAAEEWREMVGVG
ncbi:MAG: hypothetical protein JWR00_295 [Rubritepida sp.]|nr:hypothetical protein [Rubritepida sp.]